jgi:hypothetical protein
MEHTGIFHQDNKTIDFIIAVKDIEERGTDRLYWALHSLTHQTILPNRIFVIDGSINKDPIKKIVKQFDCEYVAVNMAILNIPVLWNKGIKLSKAEYVGMSCVDVIYEKGFVEYMISRLQKKTLFLAYAGYLTEIPTKENIDTQYWWDKMKKICEFKSRDGLLQLVEREWITEVRGYDERYLLWTCMDCDLIRRARDDGMEVKTMFQEKEVGVLHQEHPRYKDFSEEALLQQKINHALYERDLSITKNQAHWGESEVIPCIRQE